MIGYLNGRALRGGIVLVGGVGYLVATPSPLVAGEDVELWVHTVVRENDISLYGFPSPDEAALFAALMKVTGVGAKIGLAILALGAGTVVAAIRDKDEKALAKAHGLGPAKARQIIAAVTVPAELTAALATVADPFVELVAALSSLGFDAGRARVALEDASAAGINDESALMRAAMTALRAA